MSPAPVITIDGPAGSGKGTVSRLLAERLGYGLLESGAIYRLLALAARRRNVKLDDSSGLAALAHELDVEFGPVEGEIFLDGGDVARELHTPACADGASRIAALPDVRAALLQRQQAFRQPPGLVAEGRDMGTVVFPDAQLKIFLTASLEERAERRYKQLKQQGIGARVRELFAELAARDKRDESRSVAPLKPAEDAIVLDSSSVTVEDVLARVLSHADRRLDLHL
ncbi:MAG: (d)CMP kinase [Gammaproteobacteria bacterium]